MNAKLIAYVVNEEDLNEYMKELLSKGCEVTGEIYSCEKIEYYGEMICKYTYSEAIHNAVRDYLTTRES